MAQAQEHLSGEFRGDCQGWGLSLVDRRGAGGRGWLWLGAARTPSSGIDPPQVFDGAVIILSLAPMVASTVANGPRSPWDAISLIILLRIWRVKRVLDGECPEGSEGRGWGRTGHSRESQASCYSLSVSSGTAQLSHADRGQRSLICFSFAGWSSPHLRAHSQACPRKTSSSQAQRPLQLPPACSGPWLRCCSVSTKAQLGARQACQLANSQCVWELLAGGFSLDSLTPSDSSSLGPSLPSSASPFLGPGCPALSTSPRRWVLAWWLPCFQKVVRGQSVPLEEGAWAGGAGRLALSEMGSGPGTHTQRTRTYARTHMHTHIRTRTQLAHPS